MEHQPPPFFKTGPTPLARLLIYSALSFIFLVADARFHYLDGLRQVAAVLVYPFQRLAAAPAGLARRMGEFFVTHSSLRSENSRLQRENFDNAARLQQLEALRSENAHLRALHEARSRVEVDFIAAEALYSARDPFTRKIVVDRGARHDVLAGQPVVDDVGVIGQITRVYPWLAEVTLITDKGQFVPVQNVRNGLRAVLSGTGNDSELELRFVPPSADYQNGDRLVTSGIDGVYPPGFPVARVTHIERSDRQIFARITCAPLGGVASYTHVLIVRRRGEAQAPPRPPEESKSLRPKPRGSRKG